MPSISWQTCNYGLCGSYLLGPLWQETLGMERPSWVEHRMPLMLVEPCHCLASLRGGPRGGGARVPCCVGPLENLYCWSACVCPQQLWKPDITAHVTSHSAVAADHMMNDCCKVDMDRHQSCALHLLQEPLLALGHAYVWLSETLNSISFTFQHLTAGSNKLQCSSHFQAACLPLTNSAAEKWLALEG